MINYTKKELGKFGENIAVKFLKQNKYEIIERNFTCRQGEIDIIAKDEKEIVFIEVKTRKNFKYGKPADAVDYTKQRHIFKTAKYFLYKTNLLDANLRFDVIEVYIKDDKIFVNHIKQAM